MTHELRTKVKWRSGFKRHDCVLIGNQTVKLQKADGEIIFDLTRDEITKVRIQQQYIYISVGPKVYTFSVVPEAQQRVREKLSQGKLKSNIDVVTGDWKSYFDGPSRVAVGPGKPLKVRRVSTVGFFVIMGALLLITRVLGTTRYNDQPAQSGGGSQSQSTSSNQMATIEGYVISGYTSNAKYTKRTPDFNDPKTYATYEEALAAGKSWQQQHGPNSTVDIIQLLAGEDDKVIAVYDKNGLEIIKY